MSTSDQLNVIIQNLMTRFGRQDSPNCNAGETASSKTDPPITPQQLIVAAAILAGVLNVESILVDKNQNVEILVSGTLKRKTQLDKLLDQIGSRPFDEVIQSLIGRL